MTPDSDLINPVVVLSAYGFEVHRGISISINGILLQLETPFAEALGQVSDSKCQLSQRRDVPSIQNWKFLVYLGTHNFETSPALFGDVGIVVSDDCQYVEDIYTALTSELKVVTDMFCIWHVCVNGLVIIFSKIGPTPFICIPFVLRSHLAWVPFVHRL